MDKYTALRPLSAALLVVLVALSACVPRGTPPKQEPDLDYKYMHDVWCGDRPIGYGDTERVVKYAHDHHLTCVP